MGDWRRMMRRVMQETLFLVAMPACGDAGLV
jgi:hypothetical protein